MMGIACLAFPPYMVQYGSDKYVCVGGWAFEAPKYALGYSVSACSVDWSALAIRLILVAAIYVALYWLTKQATLRNIAA